MFRKLLRIFHPKPDSHRVQPLCSAPLKHSTIDLEVMRHSIPEQPPSRSPSLRYPDSSSSPPLSLPIELYELVIDHVASSNGYGRERLHALCACCLMGSRILLVRSRYWLYHTMDINEQNYDEIIACLNLRPANAGNICVLKIGGRPLSQSLHDKMSVLSSLISINSNSNKMLDLTLHYLDLSSCDISLYLALSQLPPIKRLSVCEVLFSSVAQVTTLLFHVAHESHRVPLHLNLEMIHCLSSATWQPYPPTNPSQGLSISSLSMAQTDTPIVFGVISWISTNASANSMERLVLRVNDPHISADTLSDAVLRSGPSLCEFALKFPRAEDAEPLWLQQISLCSNTNLHKLTLCHLTSSSLSLVVSFLQTITSLDLTSLELFFSLTRSPTPGNRRQWTYPHLRPEYWKKFDQTLSDTKFDKLAHLYVDIRKYDEWDRNMDRLKLLIPSIVKKRGFYYALPEQ